MNLRFSLLSFIGLLTLIAIEFVTIKDPSYYRILWIEIFVEGSLLLATWGAFFFTQQRKRFVRGFAVLAWATIIYATTAGQNTINTNSQGIHLSMLSQHVHDKFVYKPDQIPVIAPEPPAPGVIEEPVIDRSFGFYIIWNLWSIFNFGLLGGLLALQFIGDDAHVKMDGKAEPLSSDPLTC